MYGLRPVTEPIGISATPEQRKDYEALDAQYLPAPTGALKDFRCQVFWDCENVPLYLIKDQVTPQTNFDILREVFVKLLGVDSKTFKIRPVLSKYSAKKTKLNAAVINSFQRFDPPAACATFAYISSCPLLHPPPCCEYFISCFLNNIGRRNLSCPTVTQCMHACMQLYVSSLLIPFAADSVVNDVTGCQILRSYNAFVDQKMPEGRGVTDNESRHEADVFIKGHIRDYLKSIKQGNHDPSKSLVVLISGDKGFIDVLHEAHDMGVPICVIPYMSNKSCAKEIWNASWINWIGDWHEFIK